MAVIQLTSQRCFHHAGRDAAARCVGCGRAYCRECVAEHSGRMLCAACLRGLAAVAATAAGKTAAPRRAVALAVAEAMAATVVVGLAWWLVGLFLRTLPLWWTMPLE